MKIIYFNSGATPGVLQKELPKNKISGINLIPDMTGNSVYDVYVIQDVVVVELYGLMWSEDARQEEIDQLISLGHKVCRLDDVKDLIKILS